MRRRAVLLLTVTTMALLAVASPAWAAEFEVNSTGDQGDENPGDGSCFTGDVLVIGDECTLRAAIQEANDNENAPTVDKIRFGVPTTGVATISPASELDTITEPVTINGYSQPGSRPNTATTGTNAVLKIVLDGFNSDGVFSGLVVKARNSTVRGLVINNGFRFGVLLDEETPSDKGRTVEGCFIGTDASGTQGPGNNGGVIIDDGEGNVVGGNTLAARNLISANTNAGVFVSSPANGNTIQGNLIGTNKNGTDSNLGNFTGVHIVGGSNNTIGGNGAATNTIAYNRGRHGVQVQGLTDPSSGTGNRILSNSIHSNAELGIQLGADGVTPNDPGDADTGANRLQNFPVLTSATRFLDRRTGINGRLNSTPNRDFTIQFFSNPSTDPNEGRTFLGEIQVTTNRKGNTGTFTFTTNRGAVSEGQFITATATRNSTGDTSEFSQGKRVEPPVFEQTG
jgi:CSLREA domain-containing protein